MVARGDDADQPRNDSCVGTHMLGHSDLLRTGAFTQIGERFQLPLRLPEHFGQRRHRGQIKLGRLGIERHALLVRLAPDAGQHVGELGTLRLQEARRRTALDLQRVRQVAGGNGQRQDGLRTLGAAVVGIAVEDELPAKNGQRDQRGDEQQQ